MEIIGSGKSKVAQSLSESLGIPYTEADNLNTGEY